MREEIKSSVSAAIAKQKHIEPNVLTEASSLDELGITSLDAITIVYDIEEKFGIEVPGDVLEGFKTVQDIVDCVLELVNAKP